MKVKIFIENKFDDDVNWPSWMDFEATEDGSKDAAAEADPFKGEFLGMLNSTVCMRTRSL